MSILFYLQACLHARAIALAIFTPKPITAFALGIPREQKAFRCFPDAGKETFALGIPREQKAFRCFPDDGEETFALGIPRKQKAFRCWYLNTVR